jgi:hypothetical protein
MPSGGIRTHNSSKRAPSDLRLRPRGHWDRPGIRFRQPNDKRSWVVLVCSASEQDRGEHKNVHKIVELYTCVCVCVCVCVRVKLHENVYQF